MLPLGYAAPPPQPLNVRFPTMHSAQPRKGTLLTRLDPRPQKEGALQYTVFLFNMCSHHPAQAS